MKNAKKLFCLICVLLLAMQMAVAVSAAEYVKWELSEDGSTLYGDGKAYTAYPAPMDFTIRANSHYCYENEVNMPWDGYYPDGDCPVESTERDGEIVWIKGGVRFYLFVASEAAKQNLDAFFSGEEVTYALTAGAKNAPLAKTAAESMIESAKGSAAIEMDVRDLELVPQYEIAVRDMWETVEYACGSVFLVDDTYYYVHYPDLGNQYFDAYGNFSFRSGSVGLYTLEESAVKEVKRTEGKMTYRSPSYDWEEDGEDFSFADPEISIGFFLGAYILLGFVVPAAFAILGIVFANRKKLGKPDYWYSLTAISGVWILLAAILLAILL